MPSRLVSYTELELALPPSPPESENKKQNGRGGVGGLGVRGLPLLFAGQGAGL